MEEEEKEETAEGLGLVGSARKWERRMKREGAERGKREMAGTNTEYGSRFYIQVASL